MKYQFKDIPFLELFLKLKRAGFQVPLNTIYEFEKIMLLSGDGETYTAATIIQTLTSLIAKNGQQQTAIQDILKEHFLASDIGDVDDQTQNPSTLFGGTRYIFLPIIFGILILSFYVFGFFKVWKQDKSLSEKLETASAVTNKLQAYIPVAASTDTLSNRSLRGNSTLYIDTLQKWLAADDSLHERATSKMIKDHNVPYSGPVFTYLKESGGTLQIRYENYWYYGLFTLTGVFIFCQYYYYKRRRKNEKDKLEELQATTEESQTTFHRPPFEIIFESDDEIFNKEDVAAIRSFLHHSDLPSHIPGKINAKKTAFKAAFNAGYIEHVYDTGKAEVHFTFLIDKKNPGSHLFFLQEWVADIWTKDNLRTSKYYFLNDFDVLYHEDGSTVPLVTSSDTRIDHALIVFSEAARFWDTVTPALKEDAALLLRFFNRVVIIVPESVVDWSFYELSLLKAGFIVIPLELEVISCYLNDMQPLQPGELIKMMDRFYSVRVYDFDSPDDIEEYLADKDLFLWLCALSVYPTLHWHITLQIGQIIADEITGERDYPLVSYSSMLKLSRIKWLSQGRFSDELRFDLLQRLPADIQLKVRVQLKKMLLSAGNNMTSDSFASIELVQQKHLNEFLIYAKAGLENMPSAQQGLKQNNIFERLRHTIIKWRKDWGIHKENEPGCYSEGFEQASFDAAYVHIKHNWEMELDWPLKRHIAAGANSLMPQSTYGDKLKMNMQEYTKTYENEMYLVTIAGVKRVFFLRIVLIAAGVIFLSVPFLSSWLSIIPRKKMEMHFVTVPNGGSRIRLSHSASFFFADPMLSIDPIDSSTTISNLYQPSYDVIFTDTSKNHVPLMDSVLTLSSKENSLYRIGFNPVFVLDMSSSNVADLLEYVPVDSNEKFTTELFKAMVNKSAEFFIQHLKSKTIITHGQKTSRSLAESRKVVIRDLIDNNRDITLLTAWMQPGSNRNEFAVIFRADFGYFVFFIERHNRLCTITDIVY